MYYYDFTTVTSQIDVRFRPHYSLFFTTEDHQGRLSLTFAASPPWRAEARSAKWAALNCTAFEASVMDNHHGDVTDHRVPRTVDQHLGARRAW